MHNQTHFDMDYKKLYDKALELTRQKYEQARKDNNPIYCIYEEIFPELRESEDERIRQFLIERIISLYGVDSVTPGGIAVNDIVLYLEKQKINTEGDFARGYDCGYECCLNSHGAEWFEKQKEIPMPNSTELIEMWHKEKAILKEKDFRGNEWRLAQNAFIDGFAKGTCVKFEKQKEQKHAPDDLQKSFEAGQTSIVDNPEQYGLCKKAEWSEEDDATIKSAVHWLEKYLSTIRAKDVSSATQDGILTVKVTITNLKSLRPSWKPSEEHLSALLAIFNDPDNIGSQACQLALTDLYEQLKNL